MTALHGQIPAITCGCSGEKMAQVILIVRKHFLQDICGMICGATIVQDGHGLQDQILLETLVFTLKITAQATDQVDTVH